MWAPAARRESCTNLRRWPEAWRAGLGVLAIAAAAVPVSPPLVYRYFSRGRYPATQPLLTGISNRVPFALFDVLLGGVGVWWAVRGAADVAGVRRRGARAALGSIVSRTLVTAAVASLAFL